MRAAKLIPTRGIAPVAARPGLPAAISRSSLGHRSGDRYRDRVLGTGWTEVVALAAAFAIALLATPAGISGAVLLLPFQVSVLGTPSPAVTPTNLLYNVVATPGALYRYWRQGQAGGRLAWSSSPGRCPAWSPDRSSGWNCCPAPHVFDLVVARCWSRSGRGWR